MALSIKNPRAEELAALVSKQTGETMTDAVIVALEERLERLSGRRRGPDLATSLKRIAERCQALPDRSKVSPDEILGYDAHGTFEEP
ncbi:MAG TPA: type II toxin-antitoxin system VapB family antitoxin [Polyangiaceae bacterium]|nr:type II toxin-antitoxin system VapB family antitoxin [Polyangiaceae bacterium]